VIRFVALACLVACSSSPSKTECGPIVDHLIEVFTAGKMGEEETRVPKDYPALVESWRRVLRDDKDATHELLVQICTTQMSSGATSCVMAAKNERQLAACFTN